MKQLGIALHAYNTNHSKFPPGVVAESNDLTDGMHSGLTMLLPMIDQGNVYSKYDFNRSWRNSANQTAVSVPITLFRCPETGGSVPQPGGFDFPATDYAFSKGPNAALCREGRGGGMFDINSHVRTADVTDGLSNTFAMGEASSLASLAAEAT